MRSEQEKTLATLETEKTLATLKTEKKMNKIVLRVLTFSLIFVFILLIFKKFGEDSWVIYVISPVLTIFIMTSYILVDKKLKVSDNTIRKNPERKNYIDKK
jgi:4-hydroxybenzoate polyprenyltransferase